MFVFKSNERSEDSYIVFAECFCLLFSGKSLKVLMQLGIMLFLSSIEIHLLKVTLPIDPVFSSWVLVIKKAPIKNCSRNSKSLKCICFSFEIRKLSFFFSRKSVFFMFICVHYSFPIFE